MQCPSCECITRMRSPAGYIENTPVRIHCGNCNTLLTGEFISDGTTATCKFIPSNCQVPKEYDYNYDFYGEASGEVLCHKICKNNNPDLGSLPPFLSPVLISMHNMDIDVCEKYIDYACHISELKLTWDKKVIPYNLFIDRKYDVFIKNYKSEANKWGFELIDEPEIQRYIHCEYLYDFGMIFGNKKIADILIGINYEFNHFSKTKIEEYIEYLMKDDKLKRYQSKMFSIMKNYINIANYIMPALSATFYKNEYSINKIEYGISTCSFEDIKNFYIDSFESLADCCDIIKCLDNLKYREDFKDFGTNMTIDKFNLNTKNGNRIKELKNTEYFSNIFNLKDNSNDLRNAIGHNNYEYDGCSQLLIYSPNKQQADKVHETYLLDVAISCIDLMKNSIILEFIIYELFRESYRYQCADMKLHPLFYKKTNSNNHCPCGSRKKYTKCCKKWVISNKKIIKGFNLPLKSKMRFNNESIMNYIKGCKK